MYEYVISYSLIERKLTDFRSSRTSCLFHFIKLIRIHLSVTIPTDPFALDHFRTFVALIGLRAKAGVR